ncbi:MAG: DoxX family protein [Pseudomonadota bacterium]
MANSTIGLPHGLALKIATILLGLAFLFFGALKLAGVPDIVAMFETFGLPAGSNYAIGALEVVGAIGLFVRPVARYAALLLLAIAVGAVITHVINPPLQQGVPALVLLAVAAYVAVGSGKSSTAVNA